MQAFLLILALALPARAGVAASAEAGADAVVPRITVQTSLSPSLAPTAGAATGIGLQSSLSAVAPVPTLAPSAVTAIGVSPAATLPTLPVSAITAAPAVSDDHKPVLPAAAPSAFHAEGSPVISQPTFKTRILGMLKSLANPFGTKSTELPPPASEAERLDREFNQNDYWEQVAPAARAEIEGLRERKLSKAELSAYVKTEADAAIERIKAARGVTNIGFHYNLHGGRREEFVGVGIRATMGDIALRYTMSGDTNYKVYFFQSGEHGGFVPLDSQHGEHLMVKMRMGYALNLFNLDAPALKEARADGRIKNFGSISMDFHGMKGVPYEAYLAPPVEVFTKTAKKIGLRKLSWDEETLATIRFLEAATTAAGDKIPGGTAASEEAVARGAAARAKAAASAGPKNKIIPQFALVDNSFFYHGTTLDDIAAIVASGGLMKPDVSQFSLRARDSVEYAGTRAHRLGRKDNPEVLLQFDYAALNSYVSGKQFQAALAMTDRGMPPVHAAYSAAEKPVPLSLMTAASKTTILSWMRANNDPRLAAFEAALK